MCWAPFIFISVIHNLKVIDATKWYASFAMTLLPVNSMINPLIYDNHLMNTVFSYVVSSQQIIANSTILSWWRGTADERNVASEE